MTFAYIIFNNLLFYSFIFLFILQQITKYIKMEQILSEQIDNKTYIIYLKNYYINNKYYSIFIMIFYLCCYFVLFFYFRISILGSYMYLTNFNFALENINFNIIFNLVLYLLNIIYYIKILNNLFYNNMLKIHIYLSGNVKYNYLNEKIKENQKIISSKYDDFYLKIAFYLLPENQFIFYRQKFHIKTLFKSFDMKFYKYLHSEQYIASLCRIFLTFLGKINNQAFISRFLYYIPYSISILVLFYDINNGSLFYIYYVLFILFILNFFRKLQRFIYIKDPLYDSILNNYLYEKKDNYSEQTVLNLKNEIINYLNNNFTVDYVLRDLKVENICNRYAKRLHIIFLLLCFIFYHIIFAKYEITIYNFSFNLMFIMIIIVILLYIIHQKIIMITEKHTFVEHFIFKWLFNMISLIIFIIVFYILLKNKITINISEIIFEVEDYFCLIEKFTLQEKQFYLKHFLENYLLQKQVILLEEQQLEILELLSSKIKMGCRYEDINILIKNILKEKYLK